jgi:uncharacterized protein (TIGR02246 family)
MKTLQMPGAVEDAMRGMISLCATASTVTLVSLFGLPSALAGDEPIQPPAIFHEIVQKLVDAENSEDDVAMAALFTDDAILLPPGGAVPIQGKENIRAFLKGYAKHKMDNHKITPTGLLMGGPKSMIDTGVWSGDVPAQDGAQPTHVTGTYLAVGIFVDGQWKLWADSWQVESPTGAFVGSSTPPQVGTSAPNK